jgi:hypothetical protein
MDLIDFEGYSVTEVVGPALVKVTLQSLAQPACRFWPRGRTATTSSSLWTRRQRAILLRDGRFAATVRSGRLHAAVAQELTMLASACTGAVAGMLAHWVDEVQDGGVSGRRSRDHHESRTLDDVSVSFREEPLDHAEVLGGYATPRWERWWLSLPVRRRKSARVATATLVVVALAAAGAVHVSEWLDERDRRGAVSVGVSIGVWASSSSPPGGHVTYYMAIYNGGEAPIEVTSVTATGDRLRLRSRDDIARRLEAGREILVPMSALLTCSSGIADADEGLRVQIDARRGDGSVKRQWPLLRDATLLLDVADTLCQVQPGLTDYELSGPVLRATPTDRGDG